MHGTWQKCAVGEGKGDHAITKTQGVIKCRNVPN